MKRVIFQSTTDHPNRNADLKQNDEDRDLKTLPPRPELTGEQHRVDRLDNGGARPRTMPKARVVLSLAALVLRPSLVSSLENASSARP
jgi:hypothetical protein